MGRQHRLEAPGGFYHVTTRENGRRAIYFGNWSGRLFVEELERAALRHAWRVLAYCLMGNHYHLVVRLGDDAGLSHGMCELNGRFARATNRRLDRRDHLFGRRFWCEEIDTDAYLMEACRYVLRNPIRAGLIANPRSWRWSSMAGTVGLRHPAACLDVGALLGCFGADPERARRRFAAFVDEGGDEPRSG
jgi:REP element-mobilizing transposase RayT